MNLFSVYSIDLMKVDVASFMDGNNLGCILSAGHR